VTSRFLRYLSVALVALLALAVLGGSADAKKKRGVGKSVDSSEIEDGTIQCADISAAVFPNGCPDDDSGAAPGPGTPPAGGNVRSGGVRDLANNLTPNQTQSVTEGGFTVTQSSNAAGVCDGQTIAGGTLYILHAFDHDNGANLTAVGISGASPLFGGDPANTTFGAVDVLPADNDGVSGVAQEASLSGACRTSGHVV
jgi:hypothetical protein